MSKPFEDMSTLDRLVHEPARLAILTALAACRGCDFLYLQSLTAISKGNLSNHLQRLDEGGLVNIEKGLKGRVPQTTLRLTPKGRVIWHKGIAPDQTVTLPANVVGLYADVQPFTADQVQSTQDAQFLQALKTLATPAK